MVVDLGVGEEALFLTAGNQQLELRLPVFRGAGSREFDLELLRLRFGGLLAGLFDDGSSRGVGNRLGGLRSGLQGRRLRSSGFRGMRNGRCRRGLHVGVLGGDVFGVRVLYRGIVGGDGLDRSGLAELGRNSLHRRLRERRGRVLRAMRYHALAQDRHGLDRPGGRLRRGLRRAGLRMCYSLDHLADRRPWPWRSGGFCGRELSWPACVPSCSRWGASGV